MTTFSLYFLFTFTALSYKFLSLTIPENTNISMITKTQNNGLYFNGVEFINGGKETFYDGKLHVKSSKHKRPISDSPNNWEKKNKKSHHLRMFFKLCIVCASSPVKSRTAPFICWLKLSVTLYLQKTQKTRLQLFEQTQKKGLFWVITEKILLLNHPDTNLHNKIRSQ